VPIKELKFTRWQHSVIRREARSDVYGISLVNIYDLLKKLIKERDYKRLNFILKIH